MSERDPLLVNRDRMYADGRNWVPSSDLDAVKAERDDALAAIMALSSHSPFFVTIRHGADDIEICQFCAEDGRHAPDCPWLLIEAVAAGKPAFPTPAQIQALYEADSALTAVFNAARRGNLPDDVLIQVDRAISRCRAAGTKLPWPGEVSS